MIRVQNLRKEFKIHKKEPGLAGSIRSLFFRETVVKEAIKDVSLTVEPGEILGLVGANGAGKTTLTKILSGIVHPTSGSVDVLGFDPWKRDNEYRSQMSLIMGQKAQLWWDLPAADGFLLLKEIYRIPDQEYKKRLSYLAESLNIGGELNTQVRKLSLGERMKVELIAALLHSPKVVFLDEPTIGLDLTAQKAVRNFLKDYREEFSPIMILTSHYMDDIEELCERIVIMREGEFVYNGAVREVHKKYATQKLVQAQTDPGAQSLQATKDFPSELGDISIDESGKIQIHSPRARALEAAQYLLSNVKVSDLNISEEEIGEVITHIMEKGHL